MIENISDVFDYFNVMTFYLLYGRQLIELDDLQYAYMAIQTFEDVAANLIASI